jgi:uncharacterized membrane protein (DUF485 family)
MIESLTYFGNVNYSHFAIGLTVLILVAAVLILMVLAFEIWMLVDLIKNDKITIETKVLWVVGMLLVHPIVAIVYFFVARSKKLHNLKK